MNPTRWLPLIANHAQIAERTERSEWDKVRSWMQGRYWTQETGESEANLLRCSLNYVFAITETACSSLVPRSPSWTVTVHNESYDELASRMEEYLRIVARLSDMPQELLLSIQDVVLYGRSILKTTWDKKHNCPKVRRVDPRAIYFDLTAQRVSDLGYIVEVTAVGKDEFARRVKSGKYTLTGEMPAGGEYPDLLRDKSPNIDNYASLRNWQQWVTVYEVYDLLDGCTYHFFDGQMEPLFSEPVDDIDDYYNPFTIYSLNFNGQDLRGLSEILLVASNIDDVNRTLTYWMNVVRRQNPKIAVDSSMIEEESINALNAAPVGSYVHIKKKGETGIPIGQAFESAPIPPMPPDILSYLGKLESNIAFVSALAEAARGQVTGAKTATEMALIEAQLRTRLQARQTQVDRAITDIGRKMVFLSKRYLKNFRVPAPNGYMSISAKDIDSIDTEVEIIPYNPIETNRAVYEERFMRLLSFMTSRPSFDQREIDEEFVRLYRLNPAVLSPAQPVPSEGMGGPTEAELAAAAEQVGATPADLGQVAGQVGAPSQLPGQAGNTSNAAVNAARPVSRPPGME